MSNYSDELSMSNYSDESIATYREYTEDGVTTYNVWYKPIGCRWCGKTVELGYYGGDGKLTLNERNRIEVDAMRRLRELGWYGGREPTVGEALFVCKDCHLETPRIDVAGSLPYVSYEKLLLEAVAIDGLTEKTARCAAILRGLTPTDSLFALSVLSARLEPQLSRAYQYEAVTESDMRTYD